MVLATRLQTIFGPHVINHGAKVHHEAGSGTRLVGMSRWLNAEQRSRADQLVSIFENGTPLIQYDYAENLDDGRGVTVGRAGFTTATGDALDVIEILVDCPADLVVFIPELQRLRRTQSAKTGGLPEAAFVRAWKAAAHLERFRDAQDRIVDREYYEPAMRAADALGLAMPLARVQLYDAAIQHGVGDDPDSLGSLIARAGRRRSAASGEERWLDAFFDVRIETLQAPSNTATTSAWRESTDRVECMRRLARSSDGSLDSPFACEVFDATFSIT